MGSLIIKNTLHSNNQKRDIIQLLWEKICLKDKMITDLQVDFSKLQLKYHIFLMCNLKWDPEQ